jgi:copper resistance protein B
MKKSIICFWSLLFVAHATHGMEGMNDMRAVNSTEEMHGMDDMSTDPWLNYIRADQLEWRDADDGETLAWDITAWSGKSTDKLWLRTEGERADVEPAPDRHWAMLGVKGLAPYFFNVDAQFFVADHGRTAARIKADYELMLTQKLVLTHEVEINAYGKDDVERGIGSGLSSFEAGLRLRYEFVREFAPYIGVLHERKLGDTANMAHDDNEARSDTMLVIGISAWL